MKTYSKEQIKEWLEGWRGANGAQDQPLNNIIVKRKKRRNQNEIHG
jgi:hypothetical protein